MHIPLTFRGLEPEDLPLLDWTGGPEHQRALADLLAPTAAGEVEPRVVALPNGCLVGFGAVDFRRSNDSGTLWMLSIRDTWQSLGLGTRLIGALEEAVRERGREFAEITVEHDNPAARRLYLRLGYVEISSELDSWLIGDRRRYVTVCTVLRRRLGGRRG